METHWTNLAYLGCDGVHLGVESDGCYPAPMVKYFRIIKYAVHKRVQKLKASNLNFRLSTEMKLLDVRIVVISIIEVISNPMSMHT